MLPGMNKKSEFLHRLQQLSRAYPPRVAQFAYGLALDLDENTLPDDLDQAADRFLKLAAQVKAAIPAA
jgi:hypothetical protein